MRELETQRLLLRPYQSRDFEEVSAILANPELMRNFYHEHPLNLEEATAFIEKYMKVSESDDLGLSLLYQKETGSLVGWAGIVPCTWLGVEDVELSILVVSEHQEKGYAIEAARRIVEYCLSELKRARLLALVNPANVPSRRLIEGEKDLFMQFHSEIPTKDRGQRRVYRLPWVA